MSNTSKFGVRLNPAFNGVANLNEAYVESCVALDKAVRIANGILADCKAFKEYGVKGSAYAHLQSVVIATELNEVLGNAHIHFEVLGDSKNRYKGVYLVNELLVEGGNEEHPEGGELVRTVKEFHYTPSESDLAREERQKKMRPEQVLLAQIFGKI